MSDSSSGSDTWTQQSNDTSTDSGLETVDANLSMTGGDSVSGYAGLSNSGGDTVSSGDTLSGTDTGMSYDSATDSGSDSWSQSELGTYGGDSFAFTNVVFQSGGSSNGCMQDTSTDTFAGSLSSSGSVMGQQNGSDTGGEDYGSDNAQAYDSGNVTETEQIDSQDTVTGGDSGSYSDYQSGSYAGGSYAFSSVSYQDGGSDSSTETDLSSTDGTFAGSGYESASDNGGLSGADGISAGSSDSATGSSTGTDTGSDSSTEQSGHCWSLSEQGSYSNDSYTFNNYAYSSSDSNSVNSQETDSVLETVTATGCLGGSSGESNSASVDGTWTSTASPTTSGTFALGLEDSADDDEYGSFTETTTATDTATATEVDTFGETLTESGAYSAGSLTLNAVTYSDISTDSATTQSTDTYVTAADQQDQSSSAGSQDGYSMDGYFDSSLASVGSQDMVTGGDNTTEQSQSSGSVYEAGSFSNDSYSLSSYSFSQGGGDTLTSSSSDTFTSSSAGSDSGTESIDGATVYDGSGTFTETGSGNDNSGMTQTDGWSLSEQGTMAAGSISLSSYVFSETEGDSASSADNSNWSETLSGTNEGQSFSGSDSGGESDSQGESASGSLLEQGSASNGCLILSLVSYSGSGSEDGSASDQESGNWTGGYSGSDSAHASSGDNGNYSVSALGSFSNGSFSLSSYVLSGGSSDFSSQSAGEQDTLSLGGMGGMGSMPTSENFSRSDTASSQENESVYQSGVETSGSYANASYSLSDTSLATATQQTATPYYSSSDSWQSADTLTDSLISISSTNSATFGFTDTNDTGSGSTFTQSSPTLTVPGLLVNIPLPDASSVPVVGADESSGGGIPVSSPDLGVVAATSAWLNATGVSAQAVTQPNSAMPMVTPSAVGAPTQAPPPAAHLPLDGPALTPARSGPAIQNVSYQESGEKPKGPEASDPDSFSVKFGLGPISSEILALQASLPEGTITKYRVAPLKEYYKQWQSIEYNKTSAQANLIMINFWNGFVREYQKQMKEVTQAYAKWLVKANADYPGENVSQEMKTKYMADMYDSLWGGKPHPSFSAFAKKYFGDANAKGITKEQFELVVGNMFYGLFIQTMNREFQSRAEAIMNNPANVRVLFGNNAEQGKKGFLDFINKMLQKTNAHPFVTIGVDGFKPGETAIFGGVSFNSVPEIKREDKAKKAGEPP